MPTVCPLPFISGQVRSVVPPAALHDSPHVSVGLSALDSVSLVAGRLLAAHAQLHLHQLPVAEVHADRNDLHVPLQYALLHLQYLLEG